MQQSFNTKPAMDYYPGLLIVFGPLLAILIFGLFGHWYKRERLKRAKAEVNRRQTSTFAPSRTTAMLLRSTEVDELLCRRTVRLKKEEAPEYILLYPDYVFNKCFPHVLKAIKNENLLQGAMVSYQYEDNAWQTDILADLEAARFILLIPILPSEAVLWEFRTLRERGWLSKLLFLMPPAERDVFTDRLLSGRAGDSPALMAYEVLNDKDNPSILHYAIRTQLGKPDSALRLACEWQRSAAVWEQHDVLLGKYFRTGGVLACDADGSYTRLLSWEDIAGDTLNAVVSSIEYGCSLPRIPLADTSATVRFSHSPPSGEL